MLDEPPPWNCSSGPPEHQLRQLGSMPNAHGPQKFVGSFTDYVKDERLNALLKDKKVCFVGPSSHLEGKKMGSFIDSHDIVVRVNQTSPIPEHRWEDYGSRTDILASGLNAPGVMALSENLNWVKTLKFLFCPGPSMWDRDKFGRIVDSWGILWHNVCDGHLFKVYKEMGTTASTGLSAIIILLNYDLAHLYVTGISFYNFGKCGKVYYDEHDKPEVMRNLNGPNTQPYRFDIHAIEPQLAFFKRLIEAHHPSKLKMDDLLKDYYLG